MLKTMETPLLRNNIPVSPGRFRTFRKIRPLDAQIAFQNVTAKLLTGARFLVENSLTG